MGLDATALQAAVTAGTVNLFGTLPTNCSRCVNTSHSKSGHPAISSSWPRAQSGPFRPARSAPACAWATTGSASSSQNPPLAGSASCGNLQPGAAATFSLHRSADHQRQEQKILPMRSATSRSAPTWPCRRFPASESSTSLGLRRPLGSGHRPVDPGRLHDQAAPSQQQTSAP